MSVNALSDIKILDLTHYIAGPFCTKIMAALGAEVIKIEKPGEGDIARRKGPFPNDIPNSENSGLFLYLNTNKKSITLNLKAETGQKILKNLVKDADILIENYEPRVADELGLHYSELSALNPKLVMTSISNFGKTGPYRDYKADEMTLFAFGGQMYNLGIKDREPLKFGSAVSQYLGGLYGFFYTMAALTSAEYTGIGQIVDLSIMECVASSHYQDLIHYIYTGIILPRIRMMGVMPCKDGYIGLNAQSRQWLRLTQLVGMPQLMNDRRFQTMDSRLMHADELDELLLPWIIERNKEEIYHSGQALGIPVGYFATVEDLLNSAQLKAREFFVNIEHPIAGKLTYPDMPFKAEGMGCETVRAPLLGEHNVEIYRDSLGYTKEDIARLRANGII